MSETDLWVLAEIRSRWHYNDGLPVLRPAKDIHFLLSLLEATEQERDDWKRRVEMAQFDDASFYEPQLQAAEQDAERLRTELEEAKEVLKAAYKKLTDWEQYGEHPDNPLPTRIRAILKTTA